MSKLLVLLLLVACADSSVAPKYSMLAEDSLPHLFIAGGQSNHPGPTFLSVAEASSLLGIRSSGPSFALEYNRLTGREVAISYASVGGSAQVPGGSEQGDWSTSGSLLPRAFAIWDSTRAQLGPHHLVGVYWSQGERDANRISAGWETKAQYYLHLRLMIDSIRAYYQRPDLPVFMILTGQLTSGPTVGFDKVRGAQKLAADSIPFVYIGYGATNTFPSRGWMLDHVHWNVQGQQTAGVGSARTVVTVVP